MSSYIHVSFFDLTSFFSSNASLNYIYCAHYRAPVTKAIFGRYGCWMTESMDKIYWQLMWCFLLLYLFTRAIDSFSFFKWINHFLSSSLFWFLFSTVSTSPSLTNFSWISTLAFKQKSKTIKEKKHLLTKPLTNIISKLMKTSSVTKAFIHFYSPH